MALISLNNLERFFNNLKTYISNALSSKANMSHTHTTADISNLAENWNVTGTNLDISFAGSSNNNGQLSIQINGTDITTFMANQITNSTFNLNFNSFGYNLIPATDNSIDIGSSTKNLKMLYTKGITIDGTQFLPSDYIPRSGGDVLNGFIYSRNVSNDVLVFTGGNALAMGAYMQLNGENRTNEPGCFNLIAKYGTNLVLLQGTPSGTLSWGNKNVAMQEDTVPRSGGAVMLGNLAKNVDNSFFEIKAGPNGGGLIGMNGKNNHTDPGTCYFISATENSSHIMILYPTGTWTWNGSAVQLVSDQRLKQQISQIDDKLLDAWEDVELSQFKYNDAVDAKKDKARLHTGYIVQQIDEACKSHGVDVSKYGLYCHEVYQEETREVEHDDGTKTVEVVRPASEHYSLRYTEALVVECAYLRKQIELLQERLNKLEEK